MKLFTRILFVLFLGTLSWTSHGAGSNDQELNTCILELKAYFDDGTTFALIDKRSALRSSHLRIAVRLDADNTQFTDCWVPRQNGGDNPELVLNASPGRKGLIVARD